MGRVCELQKGAAINPVTYSEIEGFVQLVGIAE